MGDVIDFKTRQRKVVDLAARKAEGRFVRGSVSGYSVVECPYCHKKLWLPPGMSASFTCQFTTHRHMQDGVKLEEKL